MGLVKPMLEAGKGKLLPNLDSIFFSLENTNHNDICHLEVSIQTPT